MPEELSAAGAQSPGRVDDNDGRAISLTIKERTTLYGAYIPGLRNGGLFVPTLRQYALGDEVFILVRLLNDPEPIKVTGLVAWITPSPCATRNDPGIGVHFNDTEDGKTARQRIEAVLGGLVKASRPTHTL